MSTVLANTITPLMQANFVYLFVLNAVIGILEGALLKRCFHGRRRAVWWMIAANYLSAWIGLIALGWLVEPHMDAFLGSRPIERINLAATCVLAVSFVITLLVEGGMVYLATEPAKRSCGRTVLATLCVNAASYIVVCAWFLWSSYSLPLNARISAMADLGHLPRGTLYWVAADGQVMARSLDVDEPAQTAGQVMQNDFVKPYQLRVERAEDSARVQVNAQYSSIRYANRVTPANLEPPDPLVLADAGPAIAFPGDYWDQSHMLRKSVLDVRPPDRRQSRVSFDWYRHFLITDTPDGRHSHLCVGFATVEWRMQEPTILPDDKIVFEWAGQIVLFDPRTRRLAFVALGTCPAFVPSEN